MRRLVGLLVVLVPVGLFIAGCGSGGAGSGKSAQKSEPEMKDFTKQRMEEMQKAKMGMKAPPPAQTPPAPEK